MRIYNYSLYISVNFYTLLAYHRRVKIKMVRRVVNEIGLSDGI